MSRTLQRPLARGVVVGALAVAIVASLADFIQIDRSIGTIYSAINRYESPDVIDLAAGHSGTVDERFRLYLEVRRWAHGADVALPPGSRLRTEQLVGLGGAGEVTEWSEPPELTPEHRAAIEAHTVHDGQDRDIGDYRIAVVHEPDELVVLREAGTVLLVDRRLLDGGQP